MKIHINDSRLECTRFKAWLFIILFAGGLILTGHAKENKMNDVTIGDAIEDELMFDRVVNLNNIDIKVTDGILELTGSVDNILAKEHTTRVAQTVKGVRSVINRIEVKPSLSRSDTDIRSDVKRALAMDSVTEAYEVNVAVKDGAVTLTGTVDSWQEKQMAETVAKGVKGVTKVKNNLQIIYKSGRLDQEIKPEIESRLRWDMFIDDSLINVTVDNGKVTLSGTVGSAGEKVRAAVNAWVSGVKSVDDSQLQVSRWARDDDLREDKYVTRKDDAIKKAIEDAFVYDPRVLSFNVKIEVDKGYVTLRGTVDNLRAKAAAESVARDTVGVIKVTNRLKVRSPEPITDDKIAQQIRDALLVNPYTESYEISVKVKDGVVTLTGTVDSYLEKAEAEYVASGVKGVSKVKNKLDVFYIKYPFTYSPYTYPYYPFTYHWHPYAPSYSDKTDVEIKLDIQDELWWSPFVDADQVDVEVVNGVATLTGTVDSWSEWQAAQENAYEGGAIWVYNNLEVQ